MEVLNHAIVYVCGEGLLTLNAPWGYQYNLNRSVLFSREPWLEIAHQDKYKVTVL